MEKTRLLVIDDNKDLVEMINEYFTKVKNIDVVLTAGDGNEAIKLIEGSKDEFDIIILDLVMPKKDGLDVLEYLYENKINKKVIVLTSYNNQEIISRAANLGASYFMLKPFELTKVDEEMDEDE